MGERPRRRAPLRADPRGVAAGVPGSPVPERPVAGLSSVTVRFGSTTALDDVTVTVGDGVTGLVGANGAGKTTLISVLLGLRRPTRGTARVLGRDPATAGPWVRARLGWSPEHHRVPTEMRAYDFVVHMARVRGLPVTEARSRANDLLWLCGLGEERFRPLGSLSTGQRQRVKLAQALVSDPELALLDEPTEGLDPTQRDGMLGLIRRAADELGVAVVVSSHVLSELERIADRVILLDAGRVVAAGPVDEVTGVGTGLVVEVDDRLGAVAGRLRAAGVPVTIAPRPGADAGRIVVEGDDPDRLADLIRDTVAAEGAPLHRLGRRLRTLEDLFVAATAGDGDRT